MTDVPVKVHRGVHLFLLSEKDIFGSGEMVCSLTFDAKMTPNESTPGPIQPLPYHTCSCDIAFDAGMMEMVADGE